MKHTLDFLSLSVFLSILPAKLLYENAAHFWPPVTYELTFISHGFTEGEAATGPEEGGETHDGGVCDAEVGTRRLRKCDVTLCHR